MTGLDMEDLHALIVNLNKYVKVISN